MKKASRKDKARIMEILLQSFENDPHAHWFTAPRDRGRKRRMRALMNFATEEGLAHDAVYLTDDRNGVAIWKTPANIKKSIPLWLAYLDFGVAMGFSKVQEVIRMEKEVKKGYPPAGDYLYLWFLGVIPDQQGKGLSTELFNPMLALADQRGQDVYLETANLNNVTIYEKKEFALYDQLTIDSSTPLKVYCMRRTSQPMTDTDKWSGSEACL